MLMPPDNQIHPLGYILRIEGLMQGRSSPKPLLIPILMKHEYLHIIIDIPLWRLKPHLLLLKQLVQDQILDVPQTIQRNLTRTPLLRNDQRTDEDLVQVGELTKIVYIVTSL